MLSSAEVRDADVASVEAVELGSGAARVGIGQLASTEVGWEPAVIRRRDGERVVRVMAGLLGRAPVGRVVSDALARVAEDPLPEGVRLEVGGMSEGASQANVSMLRTFPVGLVAILLCLMWEFRSFKRVGIILVTVPLAAAGVVPGLVLAGEPLGFMSMLGIIAICGIVVNNAIMLLDAIERRRAEVSVTEAITDAVRARTRPILLTTLTTVAGLAPLAFSRSTLWPPLAWAMSSGLLASTALTLVVVPALYRAWLGEARAPEAVPAVPHAWPGSAPPCSTS